ncbi:hypothetical protein STIAU_5511, partial [Stigmatella aurantiaca DW4/3-1]
MVGSTTWRRCPPVRPENPDARAAGPLNREGRTAIAQLEGDCLMVVVEGVEAFPTGGTRAMMLGAFGRFRSLPPRPIQSSSEPASGTQSCSPPSPFPSSHSH